MSEITSKSKVFPRQSKAVIDPYATNEELMQTKVINDMGAIKVPETAISTHYYDNKCPFTGDVKIRGRIFKGKVIKMKAQKTVVVRIDYLNFDKKYKRFSRRNSKISVHLSPCFMGLVHVGSIVECGETRPLSKTKSSAVIKVLSSDVEDKVFRKN